jgi:signal transduction histidine kinase/CheY-like chemotaxis protein
MWTASGLKRRKLSYPFLEMCMHSLEDLIAAEFRDQASLSKVLSPMKNLNSMIPQEAITAEHFLKPYARSLSHELRTPMQGVVGMLDVMYAMVQEASEGQSDPRLREVFAILKENVEIVQGEPSSPLVIIETYCCSDSSRRAVEAADNVVRAYDMEMTVPDHSSSLLDEESCGSDYFGLAEYQRSESPMTSGLVLSPQPRRKRTRSIVDEPPEVSGKFARRASFDQRDSTPSRRSLKNGHNSAVTDVSPTGTHHVSAEYHILPGVRHTNIRDVIHFLANDVLKVGGRPESAVAHQIDGGEAIEVRQISSNGEEMEKVVEWMVDADVPETILVDERDLAGMISRIFHNAFKFTDTGRITIAVRLSLKAKYILVNVKDTGTGIPSDFMPSLFKAFSKEDDGINRQSEGLGLGLMVAKGLARKLNGDLYAVRSETSGPNRGTEFEMRIPVTPGEVISRPGTPYASRSPSLRAQSVDPDLMSLSSTAAGAKSARPGSATALHSKMVGPRRRNRFDSGTLAGQNPFAQDSLTQSGSVGGAEANASRSSPQRTSDPTFQSNPANITSSPCSIRASSAPTVFSQLAPQVKHHKRPPCLRPGSLRRSFDAKLAQKLPLSFLVVEDNIINRKLLISMLHALGYVNVHEAYDGADSVRKMEAHRQKYLNHEVAYEIDCVLMDLWMPTMNGYEAAEQILGLANGGSGASVDGDSVRNSAFDGGWKRPVVVAVTADVTKEAMRSVARVGMKGPLTKPYKLVDLEKSLIAHCTAGVMEGTKNGVAMMS